MTMNRRVFLKGAAFGAATLAAPAVLGQPPPRVVVVGGGAGGATAAKYVARGGRDAIDVILVEPAANFVTCFHSNLVIGGFKRIADITHNYDELVRQHRVDHVRIAASAIKAAAKQVVLADGATLAYDRLVLSPGIDLRYDSVPGWGEEHEQAMPHGWKAGAQTELLRRRLDAVQDGQLIVVIAPPNPYRCPPGPYERVSMIAHVLKATGRGRAKIVVLDPKETFSKQALFQEGWARHYPGMIDWLGPRQHEGVRSVDPKAGIVVTGAATYRDVALANVIPAQFAGRIARDAGLANQSGYCPINPATMQSASNADIYVLGDAAIAGDMPKSAFSANSQAKVAANAIRGELTQSRVFPAKYTNACWSLIDTDDAVKVGGAYEPKDGKITAVETYISKTGETPDVRKATQAENIGWYAGIVADIFG